VRECNRAAGVILNGALFCGQHANEALAAQRKLQRKDEGGEGQNE
jgi:hypothetical protein